jgi:hypothetical protein
MKSKSKLNSLPFVFGYCGVTHLKDGDKFLVDIHGKQTTLDRKDMTKERLKELTKDHVVDSIMEWFNNRNQAN